MPIDATALDSYRSAFGEEGDAFVADLFETYLRDAPELLANLRQSLDSGDAKTFERMAHTLKSNSALIGAMQISELCEEMEAIGKSGALEQAVDKIGPVLSEFEEVKIELRSILNKD